MQLRFHVLALAMLLSACGTSTSSPSTSAVQAKGTLLNVSAQGTVKRAPDIAVISAGVTTEAMDVKQALESNSKKMTNVMAAIKTSGIAEKDIQTTGINISPQYQYANNASPKIRGYSVSNRVDIRVRESGKVSDVLDALVDSGSNDINGPNFQIDDINKAQDEAREQAIKLAQARAEMYAKTLGLKVKRLVSIDDSGSMSFPQAVMADMQFKSMAYEGSAAASPAPIATGENTVTANVSVIFELD